MTPRPAATTISRWELVTKTLAALGALGAASVFSWGAATTYHNQRTKDAKSVQDLIADVRKERDEDRAAFEAVLDVQRAETAATNIRLDKLIDEVRRNNAERVRRSDLQILFYELRLRIEALQDLRFEDVVPPPGGG